MDHYKTETWRFESELGDDSIKYVNTQDDAINYLITKMKLMEKRFSNTDPQTRLMQKREYLHKIILERDLLPHMTTGDYKKGCFLGHMCNKLLNC